MWDRVGEDEIFANGSSVPMATPKADVVDLAVDGERAKPGNRLLRKSRRKKSSILGKSKRRRSP